MIQIYINSTELVKFKMRFFDFFIKKIIQIQFKILKINILKQKILFGQAVFYKRNSYVLTFKKRKHSFILQERHADIYFFQDLKKFLLIHSQGLK